MKRNKNERNKKIIVGKMFVLNKLDRGWIFIINKIVYRYNNIIKIIVNERV